MDIIILAIAYEFTFLLFIFLYINISTAVYTIIRNIKKHLTGRQIDHNEKVH